MKKSLSLIAALSTANLFADGASGGGSSYQMFIMIGVAILFFYFIILRPEKKRRKAMEQRRNSLQKGDTVTAMGIVGKVAQVKENTIVLQIDGAKLEVLKAGISDVQVEKRVEGVAS